MSFKMKDAEFYISDLKKQLEIKDSHLENYKKNIKQVQRITSSPDKRKR